MIVSFLPSRLFFLKKDTNSLKELLRLYFVHTIEDLKKFRLLSLNPFDSSYYRNSSTYRLNKKSIDAGVFEPDLNEDYFKKYPVIFNN